MVAAALAVRLAVMPFLYREWLDPNGAWAFGRVARFTAVPRGHPDGLNTLPVGKTDEIPHRPV